MIEPPSGDGPDAISGAVLALTIRRTDRDVYAAELTQSWTQNVPLFAPGQCVMRIPPEGAHEVRVRVRAEDAGPPLAGLRVLEVGGDLRAGRILAGIGEPFGRIQIRTGRVVILPRNFEPLAADPLGSIRKALAARAPVHLLIATEFLAPADRAAAVEVFANGPDPRVGRPPRDRPQLPPPAAPGRGRDAAPAARRAADGRPARRTPTRPAT